MLKSILRELWASSPVNLTHVMILQKADVVENEKLTSL